MLERNATEDFDYKGFLDRRGDVMVSLRFTWHGMWKKAGSLMIGTSPEYEMALYTLCFLSRRGRERCKVELDGCPLNIVSYDMVQKNKVYIGTVYPTAGKKTDTCGKDHSDEDSSVENMTWGGRRVGSSQKKGPGMSRFQKKMF